ncbi:MAG: HNH endonuclease [Planctomycetes bacterium]|nr:HNH endonuclease [Planctomycetota bacterium]MBL7009431.1 HNH endonuclease [Planctomycetota bacterium]
MRTELDRSRQAWQEVLKPGAMRVSKPTYKVSLLLVILDAIDAGRATAEQIPAGQALGEAFDHLLIRHGSFEGPGRWFMPRQYLAAREGSRPDQLWTDDGRALTVKPILRPVLERAEGRLWLRGAILDWLQARGDEPSRSLAQVLRHDLGEDERLQEVERLEEIWAWLHTLDKPVTSEQLRRRFATFDPAQLDSAANSLAQLGLLVAEGPGIWSSQPGDLETGWALSEQLARGDTGMTLLDTKAKRRQGQRAWSHRVKANFKGWCAVCPIGHPRILEGAHLLPVSNHPERGLAKDNGVCLCRNHHRAMDHGLLAFDGGRVLHRFDGEQCEGLLVALRPRIRKPEAALAVDGLDYLLAQFLKAG